MELDELAWIVKDGEVIGTFGAWRMAGKGCRIRATPRYDTQLLLITRILHCLSTFGHVRHQLAHFLQISLQI